MRALRTLARLALTALVATSGAACGGRPQVATWDTPVPRSEPRASSVFTVDLEAMSDCDERLDLSLYEDRNIELITWDDRRGCSARRITVRYLSRRTSKEAVLKRLRELTRKADPT
jgi:hypothetical protein